MGLDIAQLVNYLNENFHLLLLQKMLFSNMNYYLL